ncbi:MAG TPA: hypothetical protein VF713_15940, partial [Thermoanaerobaculia bacterium]
AATRPRLEMRYDCDSIEITDTRSCRTAEHHVLTPLATRIYAACDEGTDRRTLAERTVVDPTTVDEVLTSLIADKLLMDFDGHLLALAVDTSPTRPDWRPSPGGRVEWGAVKIQ